MGNLPMKSDTERPKPVKRSLDSTADNSPMGLKKPKISEEQLLQLIEINDHCLWHMFEFLDANELVSIAEAHERFIPVAISVFQRLYRKKKKLIVKLDSVLPQTINAFVCPAAENIEPLIRHFGHLISNALINFLGEKHVDIETLLQEFCADSMVELDLIYCDENDFQSIIKPFTKVEKLQIVESTLSQPLSQINIWCPNIQRLELICVKLTQPQLLEVNFPHLKHLEIYNRELDLPIGTVCETLRKNPQLKILTLLCDHDRDFIESLSRNVCGLEVLELWAPKDRFLNFHDYKYHFGMVKKFTLNAWSSRGDFLVNIPFTFDALQELTLDGFNQFKGQILDFVMQCKMVKNLKLVPYVEDWDDLMPADLRKIIDALPMLTELEFCADAFVVDDVIELLNESKKLNNVILLFMEMPLCEHFQQEIQRQWDLTKQIVEKCNSNEESTYVQFCLKRKN